MNQNLFQLILRQSYAALPSAVLHFHEPRLGHFEGQAVIKGANSGMARLLRKLSGFPSPAPDAVPLTIKVIRSEKQERWLRKFGTIQFSSTLTRHSGNVLSENFGMFRFTYSLSVRDDRLYWNVVGWNFSGIPMPDALAPEVSAWEGANADGNYEFAVSVKFPLVGVLMDYAGWLDCK